MKNQKITKPVIKITPEGTALLAATMHRMKDPDTNFESHVYLYELLMGIVETGLLNVTLKDKHGEALIHRDLDSEDSGAFFEHGEFPHIIASPTKVGANYRDGDWEMICNQTAILRKMPPRPLSCRLGKHARALVNVLRARGWKHKLACIWDAKRWLCSENQQKNPRYFAQTLLRINGAVTQVYLVSREGEVALVPPVTTSGKAFRDFQDAVATADRLLLMWKERPYDA